MDAVAYAETMARYNAWMNERLYACCASLPDAERKVDRRAFFRSIHGTLNHLLLGDRIWLGRFRGTEFRVASLDQELHSDFAELAEERRRTNREISDWARTLTPERMAGTLTCTSITRPQTRTYPMWVAVVHFFNHQTHRRGQLTTLLSQCDLDPGVTDLIWLPDLPGGGPR